MDVELTDFDVGDVVEIVADYAGNEAESQLNLTAGTRLDILAIEQSGWLWGRTIVNAGGTGLTGYFPYNYSRILQKANLTAIDMPPPPDLTAMPVAPKTSAPIVSTEDLYIPISSNNIDYKTFTFLKYAEENFRQITARSGGAIARTLSNTELIRYHKNWKHYLTTKMHKTPELQPVCSEAFDYINNHVSQQAVEDKPWAVRVISLGVENKGIRDEIFIHICKQILPNPELPHPQDLRERYWDLLILILDFFVPLTFAETFINFLRSFHNSQTYTQEDKWAKTSEMRMAATIRKGARKEKPTHEEGLALTKRLPYPVSILYVDGKWEYDPSNRKYVPRTHHRMLKTSPNTTVQELKLEMGKSWRKLDKGGLLTMAFGIYEVGTFFGIEEEVELHSQACVRDVMARWQSTRRSPDARLIYKIKLYTPELVKSAQQNKELFDLLYIHMVYGVVMEKIVLSYHQMIDLLCLKLQQEEQIPANSPPDEFMEKLMTKLRQKKDDLLPKKKALSLKWLEMKHGGGEEDIRRVMIRTIGTSAEDCKNKYVDICLKLDTYGCELFEAQYANGTLSLPSSLSPPIKENTWVVVGICSSGIKIFQQRQEKTLFCGSGEEDKDALPLTLLTTLTFPENYSKWGCSNKYLMLWLPTDTPPCHRFRTMQGVQMCYLLGTYDNFNNYRNETFYKY